MPKLRTEHLSIIEMHYGMPGGNQNSTDGNTLMIEMLESLGEAALSDKAVERLAGLHQELHDQRIRVSERKNRIG